MQFLCTCEVRKIEGIYYKIHVEKELFLVYLILRSLHQISTLAIIL